MFIELSTSVVIDSKHTKCVSLNNQQFIIQPVIINLHPKEYTSGTYIGKMCWKW